MHKYVLKLNIALLCKYRSTIYIIFIQIKTVIGRIESTQRRNENILCFNHILQPYDMDIYCWNHAQIYFTVVSNIKYI